MRILPSPLADKPWLKLCQILARRLDQTEEKLHHCHEYDIWKTNAYVVSELVNVGFFFFFSYEMMLNQSRAKQQTSWHGPQIL